MYKEEEEKGVGEGVEEKRRRRIRGCTVEDCSRRKSLKEKLPDASSRVSGGV